MVNLCGRVVRTLRSVRGRQVAVLVCIVLNRVRWALVGRRETLFHSRS